MPRGKKKKDRKQTGQNKSLALANNINRNTRTITEYIIKEKSQLYPRKLDMLGTSGGLLLPSRRLVKYLAITVHSWICYIQSCHGYAETTFEYNLDSLDG